jgi:16S rRNA A1518/A1519 N6-dimethyltransferase RsmA/KsgA/DIM1 with predicted DNA glycosylase/AP lyase activity
MTKKIEFGDFQTPENFTTDIVKLISKLIDKPSVVIEPTSGLGNFIQAAYNIWGEKTKYKGYEINEEYFNSSILKFKKNNSIEIIKCDFFDTDWNCIVGTETNTLILGNPPWVTSAKLGSIKK